MTIPAVDRALQQAVDWASASLPGLGFLAGADVEVPADPLRPSILPKNYLVEFIAGTFGPASSGRGLTRHLESQENVRRVVTRTNLGVMAAQDLEENSRRKLAEVHATRALKFKHTMELIADHVLSSTARPSDVPNVLRELFYLDDSPLAHQIAVRMAETRFVERLVKKAARLPDRNFAGWGATAAAQRFVALEGRFRAELASFIPVYETDRQGLRKPLGDDKTLKIVNRIFDVIAPRMFLIGHSQGGLVALRAMQLGMRRVRVQDSRRYLYSPRSGRVHRYSPVALAIGLGSPFDGIDTSPPEFNGGKAATLDAESLPDWVRYLMPGVGQMIHGSEFLDKLRGAFIPFDCMAISIANPKDGIVRHDRTRLPVGDFKNMHNLSVGSTESFDVAEMIPDVFRPVFGLWPTKQLRTLLNDDPSYEGMRQHCSFLVDLDANWDVDRGEIMRQIFSGESGQGVFDEMMYEVNFDGVREQLMANLLYKLRAGDPDRRKKLEWMTPRLRHMIEEEEMPFLNSIDKRAVLALNYIEPQ